MHRLGLMIHMFQSQDAVCGGLFTQIFGTKAYRLVQSAGWAVDAQFWRYQTKTAFFNATHPTGTRGHRPWWGPVTSDTRQRRSKQSAQDFYDLNKATLCSFPFYPALSRFCATLPYPTTQPSALRDAMAKNLYSGLAIIWSKLARNGSKGLKGGQKSSKPSSKLQKHTQKPLRTLQAHPLAAHFHRLKRQFWPFLKQNKCFIGEKRLLFAQFCIFSVNLGRILHLFFCLLLHHFAHFCVQLRKTSRKKIAKMTVKMAQKGPKGLQKGPKRLKNDTKRCQNDP